MFTFIQAYINSVDMTVRECLINEHTSCPRDYLCRFNTQKNRYFCCGSIKKSKFVVFLICTLGFEYASIRVLFLIYDLCCKILLNLALHHFLNILDYCPPGRAPFKDQQSLQPLRCTMHAATSSCPDG